MVTPGIREPEKFAGTFSTPRGEINLLEAVCILGRDKLTTARCRFSSSRDAKCFLTSNRDAKVPFGIEVL